MRDLFQNLERHVGTRPLGYNVSQSPLWLFQFSSHNFHCEMIKNFQDLEHFIKQLFNIHNQKRNRKDFCRWVQRHKIQSSSSMVSRWKEVPNGWLVPELTKVPNGWLVLERKVEPNGWSVLVPEEVKSMSEVLALPEVELNGLLVPEPEVVQSKPRNLAWLRLWAQRRQQPHRQEELRTWTWLKNAAMFLWLEEDRNWCQLDATR